LEVKILKETSNPAFHRKEIQFEIKHPGASTPDRFSVRQALASKMKAELGTVYVLSMDTDTGTSRTMGRSDIYHDAKDPEKIVPRHIVVRNLPAEERAKLAAQQKEKKAAPTEKEGAKPGEKQPSKPKEDKPEAEAKPAEKQPSKQKEGKTEVPAKSTGEKEKPEAKEKR
jgi:ribosomal protein S24E